MVKHVIFDFDGTIADSLGLTVKIGNQLAAKYGYRELTEAELKELRYLTVEEKMKRYNVKFYKLPGMIADFKKNFRNFVGGLEVIKGVEGLIKKLKEEGLNLGIISSNAVENISEFLKNTGLSCFDNIYSSKGLFGKHSTIKSYLKKYDIKKEEVVYIGDMLTDINACKKAGIKVISVTWGFEPEELLEKGSPDFIANSPEEVYDFIKSI